MSKPTPDVIDSTNSPLFDTQIRSRQHLVPQPSRAPLAGIAWGYREDDAVPLDQVTKLIADAVAAVGGGYVIVPVSSDPFVVTQIIGNIILVVDASAGNVNIVFPSAVGNNAMYSIKRIDNSANIVTLTPGSGQTIDGAANKVIKFQWTEVDVFSDNANYFLK